MTVLESCLRLAQGFDQPLSSPTIERFVHLEISNSCREHFDCIPRLEGCLAQESVKRAAPIPRLKWVNQREVL